MVVQICAKDGTYISYRDYEKKQQAASIYSTYIYIVSQN